MEPHLYAAYLLLSTYIWCFDYCGSHCHVRIVVGALSDYKLSFLQVQFPGACIIFTHAIEVLLLMCARDVDSFI